MNGQDMKHWRERHGYTQEELGLELNIRSRQTISSYENGIRKIPKLLVLALKALEVPGNQTIVRAGRRKTRA
jgi:transcriptional regulator with XRE-family HTH domain